MVHAFIAILGDGGRKAIAVRRGSAGLRVAPAAVPVRAETAREDRRRRRVVALLRSLGSARPSLPASSYCLKLLMGCYGQRRPARSTRIGCGCPVLRSVERLVSQSDRVLQCSTLSPLPPHETEGPGCARARCDTRPWPIGLEASQKTQQLDDGDLPPSRIGRAPGSGWKHHGAPVAAS
jgi:hypothetical protein